MTGQASPAVVLVGIDTPIGLALVRELGGHGVPVHGIARHSLAVGLHSKYLASGAIQNARDDVLIELILRLAGENGASYLMAVSENDILFLNRHRDRLSQLTFLMPDLARIQLAIDKSAVYAMAGRIGIPIPREWQITRLAELHAIAEDIQFPVVLKWADPFLVVKKLEELGLELEKARYCYDLAELRMVLESYASVGSFPLVQEFCPGHGIGQMLLMFKGEAVVRFEHTRLHEWPPEGGTSTLCMSVPVTEHAALMEQSIALLKAIEWEGPAMVEYRHDPVTRRTVLMEINGRYWGSYPLATLAGAHFAWTHLCLASGSAPVNPPYRAGLKCRFLIPEVKRLLRILFRPSLIQNRTLRFDLAREVIEFLGYPFGPSNYHYIFRWSDPRPFLADLLSVARVIGSKFRRERRHA